MRGVAGGGGVIVRLWGDCTLPTAVGLFSFAAGRVAAAGTGVAFCVAPAGVAVCLPGVTAGGAAGFGEAACCGGAAVAEEAGGGAATVTDFFRCDTLMVVGDASTGSELFFEDDGAPPTAGFAAPPATTDLRCCCTAIVCGRPSTTEAPMAADAGGATGEAIRSSSSSRSRSSCDVFRSKLRYAPLTSVIHAADAAATRTCDASEPSYANSCSQSGAAAFRAS